VPLQENFCLPQLRGNIFGAHGTLISAHMQTLNLPFISHLTITRPFRFQHSRMSCTPDMVPEAHGRVEMKRMSYCLMRDEKPRFNLCIIIMCTKYAPQLRNTFSCLSSLPVFLEANKALLLCRFMQVCLDKKALVLE
jgi:hypothetical protein